MANSSKAAAPAAPKPAYDFDLADDEGAALSPVPAPKAKVRLGWQQLAGRGQWALGRRTPTPRCLLPVPALRSQVQRMRPSPFNKASGVPKSKAAAPAAAKPKSNLGGGAPAAKPAAKGKGKAVVSDSEVGGWVGC